MSQKIKLDREQFLDKINKAYKFVADNPIVPAMANFKISVGDGTLEIMAGDSEAQIKLSCPCKGDIMDFCVNAELLKNTVALFNENELVITKNSATKLTLKNGKANYKMTMDTDPKDFPMMPDQGSGDEILMLQMYLKDSLKLTGKFINDASIKVGAQGINLAEIDNKIIFTGLDECTMCRINVPPIAIAAWTKNIVIPTTTAKKISSLLDDKGEIYICRSGNNIVFMADGKTSEMFEVTSVAMNEKFPGTEKLFTYRGEDFMTINTRELHGAISRLRLYCSPLDKSKKVAITTNPDNVNELILISTDNDFGKEGEERMTITNNAGKVLNKSFNIDYLSKILGSMEATEFQFFWVESNKVSCFIRPLEENTQLDFMIGSIL